MVINIWFRFNYCNNLWLTNRFEITQDLEHLEIDMDDETYEKMYFGTVLILVTEMISCFAF